MIVSNLTYSLSNGSSNNSTSNCTNGSSLWNVYISVSGKNIGNANAGASTTRVGFSRLSSPFTNVVQQVPVQQLAPNGNSLSGFTVTGCTGNYIINATADYTNVVVESNEYNNGRMISVTLP